MPINKFRFVSPGVQVAEIDNSQLPATPADVGPTIIGRSLRGPGLTPVRISSMSEFVEIFGMPQNGDAGNDPWRTGPDTLAPTYGAYAAQAYLRNSSPITFVRLLGRANANNDGTTAGGISAKAGWKVPSPNTAGAGGAMGLFVFPSGTISSCPESISGSNTHQPNSASAAPLTGALAAVFYCSTGSVFLVGNDFSGTAVSGTAVPVKCDSDGNLKAVVVGAGTILQNGALANNSSVNRDDTGAGGSNLAPKSSILFNFDRSSKFYIRKAFNTNPTKTNSNLNDTVTHPEWLGETFQNNYDTTIGSAQGGPNSGSAFFAFTAPLKNADTSITVNYGERNRDATKGTTPWTLAQNLNTTFYGTTSAAANTATGKLFRLHTHNYGMWESQNLKVSVTDIQAATNEFDDYGTFTVEIRMANDSDEAPSLVEVFPNCNLNPNSENFIAKKIGDQYVEWDETARRYRYYGDYVSQSKYMYIEITEEVRNGDTNPITLPFGFIGPVRFKGFTLYSGSVALPAGTGQPLAAAMGNSSLSTTVQLSDNSWGFISSSLSASGFASGNLPHPGDIGGIWTGAHLFNGTMYYPDFTTRSGSNEGNLNSPKDAYFGINTGRPGSFSTFDDSYIDLVRAFPSNITSATGDASSADQEYSFIFTLDDLSSSAGVIVWNSGSSQTAGAAGSTNAVNSSYNQILSNGYDRFTMPILGGFHGLDITEMEPFNNNRALASGKTSITSYAVNSAKMAVDVVSDPEFVESNMIVMPGVGGGSHTGNGGSQVQQHMLSTCERRADSMTLFDLVGDYVPSSEYGNKYADNSIFRRPNVQTTVDKLNARALNTSYAASYYPWVQIQDSESGKNIWVPPSVVALGTYSSSQRKSAVWFAPAGFTRGGLTEGSSGLAVTAVKQKLISKDRDKLYSANINPIASFPAEGIVIFGQKTLQVTPSALDRVNVRRLMLLVKRRISFMASRLLFEQNVQATWDRFTGQVAPFLDGIVAGNGLLDYKVILDESTTTPDLIDRNIMYAKIYLKPARSVEFIAIDFIITRTGAAFED